ncbi:MAG TPA: ECF transporter S component [Bacilli bacterium]|jgi:uncharacterized membrane protein|nr:ECF transporter S component [Bacilli bacterium]HON63443.1 ECF transporter S component [Bacilli bacterium]HOR96418.1 ECF transporter S component [Bacilli bacterium]HRU49866.1 ECF transporter S component [Bacilli bacterium]
MRKNTRSRHDLIIWMAQFAILLAIEALVCFTILGSIPMFGIVATIAMVPVVITAILLGTKAGTLMGFFAGLFSFLVWTFMPPANSVAFAFVFTPFAEPGNFFSLVICFVPRILTGTFAGLSHKAFKKLFAGKKYLDVLQYGISAVIGSLTNTVLVLVGIMVFFGPEYMAAGGATYSFGVLLKFMMLTFATNGLLEAFLAFVLASAISKPVNDYLLKK